MFIFYAEKLRNLPPWPLWMLLRSARNVEEQNLSKTSTGVKLKEMDEAVGARIGGSFKKTTMCGTTLASVLCFIFDLYFFGIGASRLWLKIVLSFNLHCHWIIQSWSTSSAFL